MERIAIRKQPKLTGELLSVDVEKLTRGGFQIMACYAMTCDHCGDNKEHRPSMHETRVEQVGVWYASLAAAATAIPGIPTQIEVEE